MVEISKDKMERVLIIDTEILNGHLVYKAKKVQKDVRRE